MQRRSIHRSVLSLTLALPLACGDDDGSSTDGDVSETGSESESDDAESSESASSTDDTVDGDGDATGDGDTTGDGDGDTTGDGDGDGDTTGDGDGDTTTDDTDTTDTDTDTTTDDETNGCIPSEELCDGIDNDCDDLVDNVDLGNDGICDCLRIGILGATGFAPNANFEAWLEVQGTQVTRTLLLNNPDVVTPAFLDQFDLVLVDRIERGLSMAEATALEDFVKLDDRGVITLIGYNFDNNNPGPERDRANTVLAPFGLAYQGGYIHTNAGVIPTFDQVHPISMGIVDVNFHGGIIPADTGNQGTSTIFATVPSGNAGLAHQTTDGGRVAVWGDEWITFDSDWQGFADVEQFWVQLVSWAKPQDFCGDPQ